MNLLHPDLQGKVESEVKKQKEAHDRHSQFREFSEEDSMYARNYGTSPKWMKRTVRVIRSSILHEKLKNGVELRRHIDQLHKRTSLWSETDKLDISFDDFPGVISERAIVDARSPPIPRSRSIRIRKPSH